MSTSVSAAETAVYLAQLPAGLQAKAMAYTQGGHWLLLWSWLVTLAICWVIVRSAVLTRLGRRLNARRLRPGLTAFATVTVFFLARWSLSLPWSSYAEWGREGAYGLSQQAYGDWLGQSVVNAVISGLFSGLFFLGVYALVRKARRWWPLWAGALAGLFSAAALIAAPVILLPFFNHYAPAPDGPVRRAVAELAQSTSMPAQIVIYDGSRQSSRFTASVSGLGATAQIAMSDAMFQKGASLAEVRAVVGHEIGHYKHAHLVLLTAMLTVLFTLGFWLIDRLYPRAAHWMGLAQTTIADPAGFPVVTALAASLTLLATPLINTVQRTIEMDADTFSLNEVRDPEALISALLKSADYRAASPSALEEALFYDHPSIAHRIDNALAWKRLHASAGVTPKGRPVRR
jgi:STE24 endopeptidase